MSTHYTARTALGAAIAARHAERVQGELDVLRHAVNNVRADRHRGVVPNDDGKLSVAFG